MVGNLKQPIGSQFLKKLKRISDMSCQGCEARRAWIKQQAELASERFKQVLQRLNAGATQTKQPTDSAKSTSD